MNNVLKGLEHLALRISAREQIERWFDTRLCPFETPFVSATIMFKDFDCKDHLHGRCPEFLFYSTVSDLIVSYNRLKNEVNFPYRVIDERLYNIQMDNVVDLVLNYSVKFYNQI